MGLRERIFAWLDERYQITELVDFLKKKGVPIHNHSVWYYFGGITLFLFFIQVATGILLLLYYKPTEEAAYESVRFIVTQVPFGWLIRSLHSWAANLMVLTAFIHMWSVFFLKAYRSPRELMWMSGVLLLLLSLAFGFSGYLLPWNELAYFATKVGTDIAGITPVIGGFVRTYLRGGEDVSGATLTRLFGIHVALLPMIFLFFLTAHLLMIQRQGISAPLGMGKGSGSKKEMPFFPDFFLRELVIWLLVFGLLAVLCTFLPWELGRKADPFAPAPAGITPEWYFTYMSQTLKYIPPKLWIFEGEVAGVLAFMLGGLLLFLVPFLDRQAAREKRSPIFTVAGAVIILYMMTMITLAYFKPY